MNSMWAHLKSTWIPRGATAHGVAQNLGALVYVVTTSNPFVLEEC